MSDQGNNYKREVMEALDSVPYNKLTGKAYKWAATHLPDDDSSKGTYSKMLTPLADLDNLDHNQKRVTEVFGFNDARLDQCQQEYRNVMKTYMEKVRDTYDDPKKSHFIAYFLKNTSAETQFVIYMNSLSEMIEKIENRSDIDDDDISEALARLLSKMKRKGGDL
jgi:hypothetical protein